MCRAVTSTWPISLYVNVARVQKCVFSWMKPTDWPYKTPPAESVDATIECRCALRMHGPTHFVLPDHKQLGTRWFWLLGGWNLGAVEYRDKCSVEWGFVDASCPLFHDWLRSAQNPPKPTTWPSESPRPGRRGLGLSRTFAGCLAFLVRLPSVSSDIHEALVGAVPGIKFGVAFCEASGKCLVRWSGTDPAMIELAKKNAQAIAAGHAFIVFLGEGFYPVNVLNTVKMVPEACRIFCPTANPTEVIVAETDQGRGILGVVDGFSPKGSKSTRTSSGGRASCGRSATRLDE